MEYLKIQSTLCPYFTLMIMMTILIMTNFADCSILSDKILEKSF